MINKKLELIADELERDSDREASLRLWVRPNYGRAKSLAVMAAIGYSDSGISLDALRCLMKASEYSTCLN